MKLEHGRKTWKWRGINVAIQKNFFHNFRLALKPRYVFIPVFIVASPLEFHVDVLAGFTFSKCDNHLEWFTH